LVERSRIHKETKYMDSHQSLIGQVEIKLASYIQSHCHLPLKYCWKYNTSHFTIPTSSK
jgi:hypothetical protein